MRAGGSITEYESLRPGVVSELLATLQEYESAEAEADAQLEKAKIDMLNQNFKNLMAQMGQVVKAVQELTKLVAKKPVM